MPPNPQMQAVLDELASITPKPFWELPPEVARRGPKPVDAVKKLLLGRDEDPSPQSVDRVEDLTIDGPGGSVDARLYAPASEESLPVVVYWHGGGWVFADIDTYDATPRGLANAAACIVVSADYRQAPENPFPAAVDDAYAVYRWVLDHAADFGGDASRVAVAGESAGGNLAAVVAMLARDNDDPPPLFQLLVYPVTNRDFETPSMRENEDTTPLSTVGMRWFWDLYLDDTTEALDWRAAPLLGDHAGLPPALIVLAEIDPLRSEGEQYGEKLRAAGVDAEVRVFEGVTHEFFGMTAVLNASRDAMPYAGGKLRDAFGTGDVAIPSVREGMEVRSLDDELLGRVKLQRNGDFLLDRSMRRDLYVPLVSVERVEDEKVHLGVRSEDVADRDWPKPMAVKPPV